MLGGLFVETAFLFPLALGAILWLAARGQGAFLTQGSEISWLLVAGGPVTMLPLLWFTQAARRLPLTVLGLFQYLGPTLSFLLAVFVYDEPFTRAHAITFGCIWTGLAIFTADSFGRPDGPADSLRLHPDAAASSRYNSSHSGGRHRGP